MSSLVTKTFNYDVIYSHLVRAYAYFYYKLRRHFLFDAYIVRSDQNLQMKKMLDLKVVINTTPSKK